jgi:UDP-N-acetylmuramate dehydrogenase
MTDSFSLRPHASLQDYNTFGINAYAQFLAEVPTVDALREINEMPSLQRLPRLILGGGSNVLFTRDFTGLVLLMCLKGIEVVGEDARAVYVRVAAGENWHGFVQWTLQHGLPGLENLSLIPGSVGAAPIQNIGAYGAEVKDFIASVSAFEFASGQILHLQRDDCAFAYRDSIFKHQLRDRVAIVDVTFAFPKQWQPNARYADVMQELAARHISTPTATDISTAVIAIRSRKLPDPARIGNAGSFFKNPIVTAEQRAALASRFPDLVSYAQPDGRYKLAAGWLIEQCGWKGKTAGAAGVYERQALVLVNHGGATGHDIARLASSIQSDVSAKFGVMLDPEPVYI